MRMAVICASGKAGSMIVSEAVARGIEVTAVVRSEHRTPAQRVIQKDLFDLCYEDIQDCEVLVDAFGAWTPETLAQHSTSLRHLCDILSGAPNRLLVVGGAGSLYVDKAHTVQLKDGPEFPKAFLPLAEAMGEALEELRKRRDVRWTYISPAAEFRADGERTGRYLLGGEELPCNAAGESIISYADYAIAVVEEALTGNSIQKRISVAAL